MKKTTTTYLIALLSLLSVNAFAGGGGYNHRNCLTDFWAVPNKCRAIYAVTNNNGDNSHCGKVRVKFCVTWMVSIWKQTHCRIKVLNRGDQLITDITEAKPKPDLNNMCTPYIGAAEDWRNR